MSDAMELDIIKSNVDDMLLAVDMGATWEAARYFYGMSKPNYPVPALLVDSVSDLGERWSNWIDTDALTGHRY